MTSLMLPKDEINQTIQEQVLTALKLHIQNPSLLICSHSNHLVLCKLLREVPHFFIKM